jgi:hypothetical protein
MKANLLAKDYNALTPEERFRLILAADGRGDEAEADRLMRSGKRVIWSMPDHAPYAQTFAELAPLMFIELLEDSAHYLDAYTHIEAFAQLEIARDGNQDPKNQAEEGEEAGKSTNEKNNSRSGADDARKRPALQRAHDLAWAAGYRLRAKANGWKLFCEQMNISPFQVWEDYPGFNRLQIALTVAEKAAFAPEEFLRWLNVTRPEGEPELTEVPLTEAGVAAGTEKAFRQRVRCWEG